MWSFGVINGKNEDLVSEENSYVFKAYAHIFLIRAKSMFCSFVCY